MVTDKNAVFLVTDSQWSITSCKYPFSKGQTNSKWFFQAVNSSKKRANEFVFTTMRCVFVCFLEEIEDSEKAFQNYLTWITLMNIEHIGSVFDEPLQLSW